MSGRESGSGQQESQGPVLSLLPASEGRSPEHLPKSELCPV